MKMPRLSVFVITLNEEQNIERCLRSVAWADELIVVDSFSTDRTVEICRRFTANVQSRKFTNYADQKNYALSLIQGGWALSLDADEELTEELRLEILKIMERADTCDAYRIARCSFIFHRAFRFSGTQSDKPIRFFRPEKVLYTQPIHEIVHVQGSVGDLKNYLNHYTYDSVRDYVDRFNRYTSMEAEFLMRKGHHLSVWDFAIKPFVVFIKLYLFQQGIRDGFEGFLFCFLSGCYVLVKYAKLREIKRNVRHETQSLCCHSEL